MRVSRRSGPTLPCPRSHTEGAKAPVVHTSDHSPLGPDVSDAARHFAQRGAWGGRHAMRCDDRHSRVGRVVHARSERHRAALHARGLVHLLRVLDPERRRPRPHVRARRVLHRGEPPSLLCVGCSVLLCVVFMFATTGRACPDSEERLGSPARAANVHPLSPLQCILPILDVSHERHGGPGVGDV